MSAVRITLAQLAAHKKLPLAFLRGLGWRDGEQGVEIPYLDREGTELRVRRRTALTAKEGSHWGPGKRMHPYGRQRLDVAERQGRLILVEGETDCATLLYHKIGALGIPGSQCARVLEESDICGVGEICIHCEPDSGGRRFEPGVLAQLADLGFPGRVYRLQIPAEYGCKDLSDLHLQDQAMFAERLRAMLAQAPALSLAPAQPSSDARAPTQKPRRRKREVVTLDAVQEQSVEWLWKQRIPRHMATLVEGDPGTGKSTLLLDLAARVTRGEPLPFDLGDLGDPGAPGLQSQPDAEVGEESTVEAHGKPVTAPQHVLILSSEDDVAKTILPRLRRHGADLSKVHFFSGFRHENGTVILPSFPSDLIELEEEIEDSQATLVLIDPLSAFLDEGYSPNRERDMRRLFHQLQQVCTRKGATLLVLRHLNKVAGADPLYRGAGSMSIIAAVRSALLVAPDPTQPEGQNVFIVAVNKKNLTGHVRSVRFRIVNDAGIGRIQFMGLADIPARELLGFTRPDQKPAAPRHAVEFLQEALRRGPQKVKDLKPLAEDAGISWRHILLARDELPIEQGRDGYGGNVVWELIQLSKELFDGLVDKQSA